MTLVSPYITMHKVFGNALIFFNLNIFCKNRNFYGTMLIFFCYSIIFNKIITVVNNEQHAYVAHAITTNK